jgi:hypothetical protein
MVLFYRLLLKFDAEGETLVWNGYRV